MERRVSYRKTSYNAWVGYRKSTKRRDGAMAVSAAFYLLEWQCALGFFFPLWICLALGICHIRLENSSHSRQKVIKPSAQCWLLHKLSYSTLSCLLCSSISISSCRAISLWMKGLIPTSIQIWAPPSARFGLKYWPLAGGGSDNSHETKGGE